MLGLKGIRERDKGDSINTRRVNACRMREPGFIVDVLPAYIDISAMPDRDAIANSSTVLLQLDDCSLAGGTVTGCSL